jgi:SAM-dependent methyltransferase
MTTEAPKMSTAEAIEQLRADPEFEDLIRDAYLGPDTREAAERYGRSAEFEEVKELVGGFAGKEVLDLGAGTGIGSYAVAEAGAALVYALEPDPSPVVGRGAIERLGHERVEIRDGIAEEVPLPDECVDVVYARQVLHHTRDLDAVGREVARVLRPGGRFICCREHVVDDAAEMERFLSEHPVHQLAGGEGAYSLEQYVGSIERGGLHLLRVWGPWDSVMNAFPAARSNKELKAWRRKALARSGFGLPLAVMGSWAQRLPGTGPLVERSLAPYIGAGRMYSFLAERPAA